MATAAQNDLSANIHIANPIVKARYNFPPSASNQGRVGLIIGEVRCAANGTAVISGFDEIFHPKGINLTDTDEVVQVAVSTGTATFNTVTAGDNIYFRIIGRL